MQVQTDYATGGANEQIQKLIRHIKVDSTRAQQTRIKNLDTEPCAFNPWDTPRMPCEALRPKPSLQIYFIYINEQLWKTCNATLCRMQRKADSGHTSTISRHSVVPNTQRRCSDWGESWCSATMPEAESALPGLASALNLQKIHFEIGKTSVNSRFMTEKIYKWFSNSNTMGANMIDIATLL